MGEDNNGVWSHAAPRKMRPGSGDKRCSVLIADDHELLLDMLRNLLEPEFEVIGTVADGFELLEACQSLRPDIALIDIVMPGLGGLDAGRQLAACAPGTRLVFLTMELDPALAAEAFSVGAAGYVLKTCPATELQHAIRTVAGGGCYLAPAIAGGELQSRCHPDSDSATARLSPRELEVLKLLVRGLSMKTVARRLAIAPRTVAFHKYRAMSGLGLRGNSQLVEFALRHGLLQGDAMSAHAIEEVDRPAGTRAELEANPS